MVMIDENQRNRKAIKVLENEQKLLDRQIMKNELKGQEKLIGSLRGAGKVANEVAVLAKSVKADIEVCAMKVE